MPRERETLWNAEANRWNIGKLVVGVLFVGYALRVVVALTVLVGPGIFPGRYPWIEANPLGAALWYGALAAACAFAFDRLERARKRARPA